MDKKGFKIGNVCISSVFVKEARFKDFRYAAYKAASDLGYCVYRNPEDDGSTQESFEKYLESKRPIFILLVGDVESSVVKDECSLALSLGLPFITLLKTSNGRITKQTKDIMNSISKATFEKNCSCFMDCEDLYDKLQKRLVDYENEKNITTVNFIPQHAQLYAKSSKILKNAKKRVVLCQRTSSLLLGERKGVNYEKDFCNKLFEWIKKGDEDMELLHIFSYEDTKNELSNINYDFLSSKNRLIECCKDTNVKVQIIIRAVEKSIMPCVICDNSLMVLLHLGDHEYNLLLPHFVTDGATVSRIVDDLQGIEGKLLYSGTGSSTEYIEEFYRNN